MTASTQSAPVRHGCASTEATRNPSLTGKARTVISILHHLGASRRQRHAARIEDARRLARLEVEVDALHAQVALDSVVLGTAATPGEITAQTRRSDEAACAALAELIWTPAERLAFHAMRAEGGAA